jgi:hypothetical protein
VNTSRQIGGAIGIAAVSSIAATSTSSYLATHAAGPAALDHGLRTALVVLGGLLVVALVVAGAAVRPSQQPATARDEADRAAAALARDAA